MDRETVDAVLRASPDEGSLNRVHHGGDDTRRLDFSANINPRSPEGTTRVYEAALAESRGYPAEEYAGFRAAAADHVDCEAREVIPTAGATGAIRLAVGTSLTRGDFALVPAPSYGEYAREIRLQGAEPEFRRPTAVADADPAGYELAVACQPNNPTGEATDTERLRDFADRCAATGTTLLVDESFLEFTELSTLAGLPATIIARSLTKIYGLPGLRMGFAVATDRHRDRLDAARPPWAIGTPAAAVGTHCLRDDEFLEATRERVVTERARLRERLAGRFDVFESRAPFLLLDAGDSDAVEAILAETRAAGLTVRDARTFRGLNSHVRVAVRMPDENDRLLKALDV